MYSSIGKSPPLTLICMKIIRTLFTHSNYPLDHVYICMKNKKMIVSFPSCVEYSAGFSTCHTIPRGRGSQEKFDKTARQYIAQYFRRTSGVYIFGK